MTELIVRELRLRRFDAATVPALPRAAPEVEAGRDSGDQPSRVPGVERLAARHSRRRARPAQHGL
ncbi:MAG TPA: hypothetical protein VG520_09870 [Candidatus Dormibacteraeota bacterium]|nr:hypothetical protein [Candidatus Dormibacteraeota bacterium]